MRIPARGTAAAVVAAASRLRRRRHRLELLAFLDRIEKRTARRRTGLRTPSRWRRRRRRSTHLWRRWRWRRSTCWRRRRRRRRSPGRGWRRWRRRPSSTCSRRTCRCRSRSAGVRIRKRGLELRDARTGRIEILLQRIIVAASSCSRSSGSRSSGSRSSLGLFFGRLGLRLGRLGLVLGRRSGLLGLIRGLFNLGKLALELVELLAEIANLAVCTRQRTVLFAQRTLRAVLGRLSSTDRARELLALLFELPVLVLQRSLRACKTLLALLGQQALLLKLALRLGTRILALLGLLLKHARLLRRFLQLLLHRRKTRLILALERIQARLKLLARKLGLLRTLARFLSSSLVLFALIPRRLRLPTHLRRMVLVLLLQLLLKRRHPLLKLAARKLRALQRLAARRRLALCALELRLKRSNLLGILGLERIKLRRRRIRGRTRLALRLIGLLLGMLHTILRCRNLRTQRIKLGLGSRRRSFKLARLGIQRRLELSSLALQLALALSGLALRLFGLLGLFGTLGHFALEHRDLALRSTQLGTQLRNLRRSSRIGILVARSSGLGLALRSLKLGHKLLHLRNALIALMLRKLRLVLGLLEIRIQLLALLVERANLRILALRRRLGLVDLRLHAVHLNRTRLGLALETLHRLLKVLELFKLLVLVVHRTAQRGDLALKHINALLRRHVRPHLQRRKILFKLLHASSQRLDLVVLAIKLLLHSGSMLQRIALRCHRVAQLALELNKILLRSRKLLLHLLLGAHRIRAALRALALRLRELLARLLELLLQRRKLFLSRGTPLLGSADLLKLGCRKHPLRLGLRRSRVLVLLQLLLRMRKTHLGILGTRFCIARKRLPLGNLPRRIAVLFSTATALCGTALLLTALRGTCGGMVVVHNNIRARSSARAAAAAGTRSRRARIGRRIAHRHAVRRNKRVGMHLGVLGLVDLRCALGLVGTNEIERVCVSHEIVGTLAANNPQLVRKHKGMMALARIRLGSRKLVLGPLHRRKIELIVVVAQPFEIAAAKQQHLFLIERCCRKEARCRTRAAHLNRLPSPRRRARELKLVQVRKHVRIVVRAAKQQRLGVRERNQRAAIARTWGIRRLDLRPHHLVRVEHPAVPNRTRAHRAAKHKHLLAERTRRMARALHRTCARNTRRLPCKSARVEHRKIVACSSARDAAKHKHVGAHKHHRVLGHRRRNRSRHRRHQPCLQPGRLEHM
eukprot:comp13241_c0_seq1/m.18078 comp13241_c0_seq1/g.18078  ORF comp13241_c0_seq1/g.18078 comp13241_c0_seq1/m.18078 type:complete len:1207 (-) comp13241_c0_seq1:213-3833(-)